MPQNNNNNNNNNQESMPLKDYIGKMIKFSFYHKLIIAKNIAKASKAYVQSAGHGKINLENMLIDKNTLEVTIINKGDAIIGVDIPYFGIVDSSLFYNPPEKLNNALSTEKSDVYTIIAIIVDIMNRTAPHKYFGENELGAYYKEASKMDSRFLKKIVDKKFNKKIFDTQLLEQFFRSHPIAVSKNKEHVLSNKIIENIELCPASFERINQFNTGLDGLMSDDFMGREKKNIKNIFRRSLAIDPSLRPTQDEVINILERALNVYVAEFYIQPCLTSVFEGYQKVKKLMNDNQSFDFSHISEELDNKKTALCSMASELSKKPIIKAKGLRNFHEIIQNAYNELMNEVENIIYVLNVKNKIAIVEKTSAALEDMIDLQRKKDEEVINNFTNSPSDIPLSDLNEVEESRPITPNDGIYIELNKYHGNVENRQTLFSVKSISADLSFLSNNQSKGKVNDFKQKSCHSISTLKHSVTHFGNKYKSESNKTAAAVDNLAQTITKLPEISEIKFSEFEELDNKIETNLNNM